MSNDTLTPRPANPDAADPQPADRSRAVLWAVVLPMIVVLAAGFIRFYELGEPERCYFDETYYYYDARDYLDAGTETSFAVHPPVGKWLIAGGLTLFGVDADDPIEQAIVTPDDNCLEGEDEEPNPESRAREAAESFARRAASALFGTGSVAVAYFVGLRLFRRRSIALLGATLLAVDGMAITMSRISMLDIFLQFFVLLGVLAMLIDRDRLWASARARGGAGVRPGGAGPIGGADDGTTVEADEGATVEAHDGATAGREGGADGEAAGDGDAITVEVHAADEQPPADRRWLYLAGVFFGLAVATKWSGLAPLGLSWAFVLGSEAWLRIRGRRAEGAQGGGHLAHPGSMVPAFARWFLALVMIPIGVYVISYTGYFQNFDETRKADRCAVVDGVDPCTGVAAITERLDGWWEEQGEVFRFHRDLQADHPYRAPASSWALMSRPVAYYYEACGEGATECVVDEGNVAEVLGMGNPAIWWMALLGYPFLLYLGWRRRSWQAAVIAMFLFGQWVPYLVSPRPVFLFYLTPAVPFIALTLAWLAEEALESDALKWLPATVTVIALGGFAFWAPLFLGLEISRTAWDALILFDGWI